MLSAAIEGTQVDITERKRQTEEKIAKEHRDIKSDADISKHISRQVEKY